MEDFLLYDVKSKTKDLLDKSKSKSMRTLQDADIEDMFGLDVDS